jgi:hypothetical protein
MVIFPYPFAACRRLFPSPVRRPATRLFSCHLKPHSTMIYKQKRCGIVTPLRLSRPMPAPVWPTACRWRGSPARIACPVVAPVMAALILQGVRAARSADRLAAQACTA